MIENLIDIRIIVALSLCILIAVLYFELLPTITSLFALLIFFLLLDIISIQELVKGFSNQQILTIMLLLIASFAIKKTGVIEFLFQRLLHKKQSSKKLLIKITCLSSSLSAFLNNTPIVAIFMPYIKQISKQHNIEPSKILIPLSFAAIMGGTITLIGTSTNLMINSLTIDSGLEPFKLFDFALIGLPLTIVGILYLVLFSNRLLPNTQSLKTTFKKNLNQYLVETRVEKNSKLLNKTILENELKNVEGLYLSQIIRDEQIISPVSNSTTICEDDKLIFVGDIKKIEYLIRRVRGLKLIGLDEKIEEIKLQEVVLKTTSPLIGKKVKFSSFRERFDSVILGIFRNGEKITGKIGDIRIKKGDIFLINSSNISQLENDFHVINTKNKVYNLSLRNVIITVLGLILALSASFFNITSLFQSLFIYVTILLLLKIISLNDFKKSIDGNIFLIAVSSLAIGKALINSGTAQSIANVITVLFEPLGVLGFLLGIYIITNILTETITNIAAASITFPIALSIANNLSLDPTAFILVVCFAASASFLTPFGYQTNLLVYSAGGYKFKDFFKIGLPLTIISMTLSVSIIFFFYF